jgi:hypothetical protein
MPVSSSTTVGVAGCDSSRYRAIVVCFAHTDRFPVRLRKACRAAGEIDAIRASSSLHLTGIKRLKNWAFGHVPTRTTRNHGIEYAL